MHFCIKCDNMYYHKYDDDNNTITFYCRNCGYEDHNILKENLTISRIDIKNISFNKSRFINKYTKYDPTLPRKNILDCPNPNCKTNTENYEKEIISIRYDDINMKYIYLCSTCDESWDLHN
uniref:DNA-directed RNA polymerase II subunit RPB9-like zinc ribbon domain-containing protein n=1 Tax=viral metagenome TaxID=1070528 RepID=A0A6C0H5E4_9ZZZZ